MVADTPSTLLGLQLINLLDLPAGTELGGHVMLPGFIRDTPSTGRDAQLPPNPFDFSLANNPNTVNRPYEGPGGWQSERGIFESGYISTGKILNLSGSVTGPGPNQGVSFGFPIFEILSQSAANVSDPFGTAAANQGGRTVRSLDGAKYAAYRSEFSGDYAQGYDAASNPNWQMVPLAGTPRDFHVNVLPDWNAVPPASYPIVNYSGTTIGDPASGGVGDSVKPGDNTRRFITPDPGTAPDTGTLYVDNMGQFLYTDIRKRREIKVRIVNVLLKYPSGASIAHPDNSPNPIWVPESDFGIRHLGATAAQIQQELNDTFGRQANVWITVTEDPNIMWVYDRDGCLAVEEADADTPIHAVRAMALQNRANGSGFFTLFRVSDRSGSRTIDGKTVSGGYSGKVNKIGPPKSLFAFVRDYASADTYAHEIGHLLGLYHTFEFNTNYGEGVVPDDARRRLMCWDRYSTTRAIIMPEREVIHQTLDTFNPP